MPKRKKARKQTADVEADAHSEGGNIINDNDGARSTQETHDTIGNDVEILPFEIPFNDKSIVCERQGGQEVTALVFTHGAGGGITAPAMRSFAQGFAAVSPIVCFQGSMNLTNRVKYFHETVKHETSDVAIAIGGRSMGARAAVLTALEMEERPKALVLVSYPLMAGSKGEKREPERREQILRDLPGDIDVLFVVGSHDAQCDLELLRELQRKMSASSWLVEVKGADHVMSVKPKKAVELVRRKTGEVSATWLSERSSEERYCAIEWNSDEEAVRYDGWTGKPSKATSEPESKKRKTK